MNPIQHATDTACRNINDAILSEHNFLASGGQDIAVRMGAQGIALTAAIASLTGYYVYLTKGNPHEPSSSILRRMARDAEIREQAIKTARINAINPKKKG